MLLLPGILPLPKSFRAKVVPGSAYYSTPGTYSMSLPYCETLTIDVYGGGGGGGGSVGLVGDAFGQTYYYGTAGGNGSLSQCYANGGALFNVVGFAGIGGVAGGTAMQVQNYAANGTASGGDGNVTGGGSGGGIWGRMLYDANNIWYGGYGGNGGRAYKTFAGLNYTGAAMVIVVGSGGAAGVEGSPTTYGPQFAPGAGGVGVVSLSWS